MNYDPRDIAIRTILGEAMGEGPEGWAAVAHVLNNRTRDSRWPSTIDGVALQPGQFSAWNEKTGYAGGNGGNHLVGKYGPDSDPYRRVGLIYDAVMGGEIADPTGGATHYFAPGGMPGGAAPKWWDGVATNGALRIGNHVFAPETTQGEQLSFPGVPKSNEAPVANLTFPQGNKSPNQVAGPDWDGLLDAMAEVGEDIMPAPPPPLQHLPRPITQPYQPVRRDTMGAYTNFLQGLRYGQN